MLIKIPLLIAPLLKINKVMKKITKHSWCLIARLEVSKTHFYRHLPLNRPPPRTQIEKKHDHFCLNCPMSSVYKVSLYITMKEKCPNQRL